MGWTAVAELHTAELDLPIEINRITPTRVDPWAQLAALWDPIRRLVPFTAAWIGLFDSEQGRYMTASAVGHDRDSRTYLESRAFTDRVKTVGLLRHRSPMGIDDTPAQAAPPPSKPEPPSWAERRGGPSCAEGLGVSLAGRDGRHLGLFVLHPDPPAPPTERARATIGALAPMIAAAVDPISSIAGLAQLVVGATAGVTVSRSRTVHPMPGMPAHPLLTMDSSVIPVVIDSLTDRRAHTAFQCPAPNDDGYVRVTGIACPPRAPRSLLALVLLSPSGDLGGLTPRELEILGLVIDGFINQHIAALLYITERTVAAHLEHIRAKLNVPTRTAAAVVALRHALYVPYPLIDVGGAGRHIGCSA